MEDLYPIQISVNLIDKLITDENMVKKKNKKLKPRSLAEPKQLDNSLKPAHTVPTNNQSGGWPLYSPVVLGPMPAGVPDYSKPVSSPLAAELDAIHATLLESERVKEKLEKQEDKMGKELTERTKELSEKEFKLPFQKPVSCTTERDACFNCYKEHSKNPLKCAGVVKSFTDCAGQVMRSGSNISQ